MKYAVYFFIGIVLKVNVFAQSATGNSDISRANLYHLQKDHAKAIEYYEMAFKSKAPDASSAYKAAGVYSLANNAERSAHYLKLALENGWVETSWLLSDPYFDYLKRVDPAGWNRITTLAAEKEKVYEKKLSNPELRRRINVMVLSDQQLRYKKIQAKDAKEIQDINEAISIADQKNLTEAKKIIEDYGWPGISVIGRDGQNNLWLIVQHADHDIRFQREVLEKMKLLVKNGQVNLENYAFLSDRVLCNLNYPQEYGTQVSWTTSGMASDFRDIRREWEVDERRKKLGLISLADYAFSYGFTYSKPTKQEYKRSRKKQMQKVDSLINIALAAFKAGNFQVTYDNYNAASTFPGGMSNKQNFKAAKVFSMIAAKIQDQKYKDISFDFLNLLNLRNKLNKKSLKQVPQFEILHNDPRWMLLLSP